MSRRYAVGADGPRQAGRIGQTHPTGQPPPLVPTPPPEVRDRYAIAYRNRVDLSGQLSNPQPALEALADLVIGTPEGLARGKAQQGDRIPRPKSRTARPLKPAQLDALIARYQSGCTMRELSAEFGIDRRTVSTYLRRAGVAVRRGGLDQEQTIEAAGLYQAGWSSGRLAGRFGVIADNVLS
jgi:hypothetical protein